MIAILDNWAVVQINPDPYQAPEANPPKIRGVLREAYTTGSGKSYEKGHEIVTSRVVDRKGRVLITSSGSQYRLGVIDPGYRKWLRENGYQYDPHNPVNIK